MTIPRERTHSVQNVRDFLRDLADPRQTARIPKQIRIRAVRLLKHYPGTFELAQSAEALSDVWGEPRPDKYYDET